MQKFKKALRASLLLSAAFLLNLTPIFSSQVSAMEGNGSEETPFRIETCQDLQDINNDLDAYYVLANDIDCSETSSWNSGAGFEPIGSYNNPFLGDLDGDYHTINNLFVDTTLAGNNSGGLFDRIGQYDNQIGLVHKLGLEDVNVTGGWSTGGLVGVLYGQVNNTFTTGAVNGSGEVGGLVGSHGGVWDTVVDSWSSASVTGTSDVVGGLVGYNANNSNIINSYAVGAVTGGDDNTGGLVGINDGNIENTYATGNVVGPDTNTGGLVGRNTGTITLSSAGGNVWGENINVGGFVGINSGEISKSYSNNFLANRSHGVVGDCSVGGFAGYNQNIGIIHNSYTRSTSTNESTACAVGGFVGTNEGSIYQTYSTGSVSGGLMEVGGYAGGADISGNIQISFWDTQLSGINDACGPSSTFDCQQVLSIYSSTSAPMKLQETYTNGDFAEGAWDFSTIWMFEEGNNDGYPILRNVGYSTVEWLEEGSDEDLNGDEIPDSEQPNVGGYESSYTGKMVAIDVGEGCALTVDDMIREDQLGAQDANYDYANGLWEFEADCVTPGATTTIKLYYYDVELSGLSIRKFNPNTNQFFDIPGATLTQETINGSSVVVATYQITDGGELDMDTEANGEIVDPAGIATSTIAPTQSLAATGSGINTLTALALALLATSILLGVHHSYLKRQSS